MKYLFFSFALFFVLLSYSQSVVEVDLVWNITQEQQPKTDSIDIDQNGSTNILIHSYFYDYWNAIEFVLVDLDGDFNNQPSIRVVSNFNNLTIQDCEITGSDQRSISGYIYSDLPNITIHQNKTIHSPITIETELGLHCGFVVVEYSGNSILIDKILYDPNPFTNCDCSLGIDQLNINNKKDFPKYNFIGQPSNGVGFFVKNGKLNYGN
jgi:hypothetical protein